MIGVPTIHEANYKISKPAYSVVKLARMREWIVDRLEGFFDKYQKLHFTRGQLIVSAGETLRGVYFLEKGYTRLFAVSEKGEELTLIIFKPGDFFPMMWTFNNTPNEYFLEAIGACELWMAPREAFLKFIRSDEEVFFEIIKRLIVRFGGLLSRMEYLVFGNAYNKVASILVICAERFGVKLRKNILVGVPLTHQDIGSLVGIARETASVELKKLEKKGLISYKKRHLVIKNLRGLKRASLLA